ncbi:hypothetical protein ABZ805_04350 [Saccharopolyspora sp. NPDC047091]|uniref:hypothetical protein n=1 Tax=Saccharopolyspora sp. NPDC047091 TaxID=3155924 RepID=UPI0033D16DF4
MLRKILAGAALTTCLLSVGAPAMAADDWRYVRSSNDRSVVEAECNAGLSFGEWSECDIREDDGFHLFVR